MEIGDRLPTVNGIAADCLKINSGENYWKLLITPTDYKDTRNLVLMFYFRNCSIIELNVFHEHEEPRCYFVKTINFSQYP